MNNISKLALIFAAGAAAGAIAGLLMAPEKGEETRRKVAGKAKDFSDAVKDKVKEGWKQASAFKDRAARTTEEFTS